MKPGEFYAVKRTPSLVRCGIRTYGAWQADGDSAAWPGDTGTVVERKWTTSDGTTCVSLHLEFSRGRSVCLDGKDRVYRDQFKLVPAETDSGEWAKEW